MIKDELKLKVIWKIDEYMHQFKGTTYFRELNMMRRKYIYTDINGSEFIEDLIKLKNIINILKNPINKWDMIKYKT